MKNPFEKQPRTEPNTEHLDILFKPIFIIYNNLFGIFVYIILKCFKNKVFDLVTGQDNQQKANLNLPVGRQAKLQNVKFI